MQPIIEDHSQLIIKINQLSNWFILIIFLILLLVLLLLSLKAVILQNTI